MRGSPIVNFRADPAMLDALRDKATQSGASVSDLVREAVREKLSEDTVGPDLMTNPFARLRPSATGDIEAQRLFVSDAIKQVSESGDAAAAIEGLVFARLAAAHGDEHDIAQLLTLMAQTCELLGDADEWSDYTELVGAEAMAIMSVVADRHEFAEVCLNGMANDATPRVMELAKQIRTLLDAS